MKTVAVSHFRNRRSASASWVPAIPSLSRGFTFTELAITLSIAATMASIALPSYKSVSQSQSVRAAASDLQTALFFARSEALKRATSVDVLPPAGDWKNGWNVQLQDGTLLRSRAALNNQLDSMPVATGSKVTYLSDGHVAANPGVAIVRVSGNSQVVARCVLIDLSGRPKLVADTKGVPANGCN